jgi:hypothetical protein
VLAVVVIVAVVIWQILAQMGAHAWQTIEGGRAVLLVALTAAFVTFGGALTISPLFDDSSNGELADQRFRRAREVFLLFAGMFSTVVGFYFASAGSSSTPVVLTHDWNAKLGELRVSIVGGKPPYSVDVEAGPEAKPKGIKKLGNIGTLPAFTFAKDKEWPTPLTIVATDSANSSARITFSPDSKELEAEGFKPPQKMPMAADAVVPNTEKKSTPTSGTAAATK